MANPSFYNHSTSEVSPDTEIGASTRIWRQAHVRENAQAGETCNIGKGIYNDRHVHIGTNVKIQNHASLFEGLTLEDGVFLGPHVCFTNDVLSRAITPDGKLKLADDWVITPTLVKYGAPIGARSIIICGITIGEFALIGVGSVPTRDVPPHTLAFGNPARMHGYVCRCARKLSDISEHDGLLKGRCEKCVTIEFSASLYI
jgi:UDP-2-acetamido-3-amino-2,3-dideoxy-glucuronate N-acetyltransferase